MAESSGNPDNPIPIHRVLIEEFNHLHPDQPVDAAAIEATRAGWEARFADVPNPYDRAAAVESALVGEVYRAFRGAEAAPGGRPRTALCFSGGGIRSATFGLGVLQGLAGRGLLTSFEYLSTVSGGGYLGGWLSGWIARRRGGGADVQRVLAGRPVTPLEPDPEPVYHLREYSRYMSPRFGLLSADTWTLVAIFFRNLILNWMVLVPLLAAALTLPRFGVWLAGLSPDPVTVQWVFWLGSLSGAWAIAFMIACRPSLTASQGGRPPRSVLPARFQTQGKFLVLCLLPLAVMAVAVTLAWYWTTRSSDVQTVHFVLPGMRISALQAFLIFGAGLHLAAYLISRLFVHRPSPLEFVGAIVSGALGGLLARGVAWLAAARLPVRLDSHLGEEIYVCLAAPLLLMMFLLAVTLFVGLASKWTSDDDREWLARAAGWILIWVVARAFLSALVIFGPLLWHLAGEWTTGTVGGISGLVTLLLGYGGKSGSPEKKGETPALPEKATSFALALAAPLFALSILVALSAATSFGLRFLAERLGRPLLPHADLVSHGFLNVIASTPGDLLFGLTVVLLAAGLTAGYFVDVNRFSLHGAYRDRLIRAYLGASRELGTRRPNPFTGFDDADNLEMVQLGGNRPFHLVNVTLNLVHGRELAWQDRKAESFTLSALHCGYRGGYRPSDTYGRRKDGARVSLGSAVAISGAAASPNMGAHSSPVITFLLALFNIRLGAWMGNSGPAGAKTYDTQGPREAALALAAETFGLTNSEGPYVYLSDGGHFENFGLYEMVIRRCRYIVVSDGSQDPKFQFEDLGNALSKIRIDLGVPIDFSALPMRARPDLLGKSYDPRKKPKFPCWAMARLRYSHVDAGASEADDGWLLYFKPSLNGTEPADVYHYAKLHPSFPHESTGNQLYSESQFESYRALGQHIVDTLPADAAPGDLEGLFRRLWNIAAASPGEGRDGHDGGDGGRDQRAEERGAAAAAGAASAAAVGEAAEKAKRAGG